MGVEPKRLTPEALAVLETFSFPGNVRQLENLCRWLLVMAPSVEVRVEDLPDEVKAQAPLEASHGLESSQERSTDWTTELARVVVEKLTKGQPEVWSALLHDFERTVIQEALQVTHGRRMEAAQRLGLGRNTLTRKVQELALDD